MKKRYLILIGGFLFVWGIGIGRYQWLPFQIIKSIQDITNTCKGENYYSEGCTERVKIKKDYLGSDQIDFAISEIKQIDSNPLNSRKELIKKTIVPIELIQISKKYINDSTVHINSKMYGINTLAILSEKTSKVKSKKCLNIYIQGHQGDPFKFKYHNKLLENSNTKGCDFLSFSMLGRGLNKGPAWFPSQFGKLNLNNNQARQHNNYAYFLDKQYPYLDPLSLFLSPQYWIINDLKDNYEDISLMGISGGGWYTVLLSAIIPEIKTSISYAGSLPLSYRLYPIGWGSDWENNLSYLYKKFSYWKLYTLMTYDSKGVNNRKSFFIYNDNDICCFSDPIASKFKATVKYLNKKNWNVIVDKNDLHTMNTELVNSILFKKNP